MKKLLVLLVICSCVALPLSALAMDAITSNAMDDVSGQAGISITWCSSTTTTIDFSELSWGDPDGLGAANCANSAGWLIIDGDVTISQRIASGQSLILDIAKGGSTACTQCGVNMANKIFIKVTLPAVTTTITTPSTMAIGLGTASATISATIGLLNLYHLTVTQGTPSALLIYAH